MMQQFIYYLGVSSGNWLPAYHSCSASSGWEASWSRTFTSRRHCESSCSGLKPAENKCVWLHKTQQHYLKIKLADMCKCWCQGQKTKQKQNDVPWQSHSWCRYNRPEFNSRWSCWRTTSAKVRKGKSWSRRASIGTKVAAFSSSHRPEGSAAACKLGGNLLQDIGVELTLLSRCKLWNLFYSVAWCIPDDLKVELMEASATLCQETFEFLFKW